MPNLAIVPKPIPAYVNLRLTQIATQAKVLFPVRIHCYQPGCQWSCPARDAADAYDVLERHLQTPHGRNVA